MKLGEQARRGLYENEERFEYIDWERKVGNY